LKHGFGARTPGTDRERSRHGYILHDGGPDKLVHDVTENYRTLIFDDYGFEES
jgi:hypothetical protein